MIQCKKKKGNCMWLVVFVFGLPSLFIEADLGFSGCWEGCVTVYMEQWSVQGIG